jgi:hypothetical protein
MGLIPKNRALPLKLTVGHVVSNSNTCHTSRTFITTPIIFLDLSYPDPNKSSPYRHISLLKYLNDRPRFTTKTVCEFLSSPQQSITNPIPHRLLWLDHNAVNSANCELSPSQVHCPVLTHLRHIFEIVMKGTKYIVLLETSVVWPEEKSVMDNSEELIGIRIYDNLDQVSYKPMSL